MHSFVDSLRAQLTTFVEQDVEVRVNTVTSGIIVGLPTNVGDDYLLIQPAERSTGTFYRSGSTVKPNGKVETFVTDPEYLINLAQVVWVQPVEVGRSKREEVK